MKILEMTWLKIWITILVAGCVIALSMGWGSLNRRIQRGELMSGLRKVVQRYFPMVDLYDPLLLEPLTEAEVLDDEYMTSHPYAGLYAVSLYTQGDVWTPLTDEEKRFEFDVRILGVGDEVLVSAPAGIGSPFADAEGQGFILVFYYVPEDVPLDEDIRLVIKTGVELSAVGNRFTQTRLCISKRPEE